MATYVNLNVNQGLINKAKAVQAQNRKSLGGKQSTEAKKNPSAAQDPGKKFGTEYQRRKVGASSDDSPLFGQIILHQRPTGLSPANFYGQKRINETLGSVGRPIQYNFTQSRTLWPPFNADNKLVEPGFEDATTNRQVGGLQSVSQVTPIQILPAGGDVAIILMEAASAWYIDDPDSLFFPPIQVLHRSTFVVSSTGIRQVPTPPGVKIWEISGEDFVINQANPGTGPQHPSFATHENTWTLLRFMGPCAQMWGPGIYNNVSGLRDESLPEAPIGWDTFNGDAVTPDNPLRLFRFPGGTAANREAIEPAVLHPDERYRSRIQYVWQSDYGGINPESGVKTGSIARTWFRPYHAGTLGYTSDGDIFNVILQNSTSPYSYTEAGLTVSNLTAYIDDSPQVLTFSDCGAPEYCRAELLALGFTEDDLFP